MHSILLALACGILLLRWTPSIPSVGLLVLCSAMALLLCTRPAGWRHAGWLLAGWCWGCLCAQQALDQRLAPELDGQTRWVEGVIDGLPERAEDGWRFELAQVQGRRDRMPSRLRLSWHEGPALRGGERWRLAVRLRSPQGLANGDGFDYAAWLLARGVGGTGSVKAGERLAAAEGLGGWRDGLRQRLYQQYQGPAAGALAALVLGDGSGLDERQWQWLQATGTLHLLVISGQHIVLIAGLLYAVVALAYRYGGWPLRWPWQPAAALLALIGGLGYGLLAGMQVPVQRACVMLAVLLLWRCLARQSSVWLGLLVALVVVLLFDPLVSLQAGFWLSFAAVALLAWVLGGRLGQLAPWRQLCWIQWAMTLGLLPLLLALGLPASPGGLLVNLLVVPWVSLLVVPLAVAGFALLWLLPALGQGLLWLAGWQLELLFQLLQQAAAWLPLLQLPVPAWPVLLLALLGVLLLLQPAGVPWRLAGALLLLPLLWPASERPAAGELRVVVLDVGQGLAVWLQTARHDLLYDAGPRTPGFDAGQRVVLPFLFAQGVRRLDWLLLSHADQDHAGGAAALLAALPVTRLEAGEAQQLQQQLGRPVQACRHGMQQQFDGVRITRLQWRSVGESNEQSCVLLLEAAGERLLLTGDIGVDAERGLLAAGHDLRAHWLLAPHHGSRSSSSPELIRAVQPHSVLISRGRHNAYRHPHPQVLARYQAAGVLIYDTARDGALQLWLGRQQPLERLRSRTARFWREN